jgi:hypothetical protein
MRCVAAAHEPGRGRMRSAAATTTNKQVAVLGNIDDREP